MAQVPQLSPYSSEFGLVQYIMQLQLGAPKFKVAEIYDIGETKQISDFNRYVERLSNTNIVDVFIDVKELQQPIADIIHRGIKIRGKEGLKIRVGSIDLEEGVSSYQYVHCIVALGKVLNFQDKNAEILDESFSTGEIPEEYAAGYNSLRVSEDGHFVIFSQEQIKSVHLVRFLGGENTEKKIEEVHICSICNKPNATLWCEQDQVKLCAKCDATLHNANKLLMSHNRLPIKEAAASICQCPHHPHSILQYYCEKCNMSVCMECKINGNHSKGEFQNHKLIPIDKAYKNAIDSLDKPTKALKQRQNKLNSELKSTNENLNTLLQNARSVEAEIMRIANEAITQLRSLSSRKANQIKSVKMELERKIDEINKIEENLKIHQENSDPVSFLEAFAHRNQLEEEVMGNTDLQKAPKGNDQFAVYGTLEVAKLGQEYDDTDSQFTETDAGMEPEGTNERTQSREVTEMEEEEEEKAAENEMVYLKLTEAPPRFTKLAKIAARKEKKYQARGMTLSFQPFEESRILTDPELQRRLYMCLPFREQPETHLMFATYKDGRSIPKMHKIIDGKGITVVIAAANAHVFGGFAATKWNCEGKPFGEGSSSFLFSITQDAFIPNKGQAEEKVTLLAKRDTLSFGEIDLKFAGNFDECRSELENNYGIGLPYGGIQAQNFLAGAKQFVAEDVEIWGFFAP
jgi:hypothetical protein